MFKNLLLFRPPALSSLTHLLILCLQSWASNKMKHLIGSTSAVGKIHEKHSLQSCFLKSNEILITDITFPVGLGDEDLNKQRLCKIISILRCRKVRICQSPQKCIFCLRLCSHRTSVT